ncbi:MAG: hypothetical protein ABI169_12410, partial [Chitinophagaceae bacterium]
MNRAIFLFSALLMMLASCSKVTAPDTVEQTLRSANSWVRINARVVYKDPLTGGDSTKNYIDSSIVCRLDNTMKFNDGFVGTINLGAKHCEIGEPDTRNFTWQATADGKHLSLYGVQDMFPMNNVDAQITTLTLGTLAIRYSSITIDPQFQTADTLIYTDVFRQQ